MIDERTSRLNLALPVNSNTLKDDCERLRETISTLDAKVATVDESGKIPVEQIPAVAITDTFPVSSESAMLALTAQRGDVAIRSDVSKTFMLMAEPASTLANWKEFVNDALVQLGKNTGAQQVKTASGKTVQDELDLIHKSTLNSLISDFGGVSDYTGTALYDGNDGTRITATDNSPMLEGALNNGVVKNGVLTINIPAGHFGFKGEIAKAADSNVHTLVIQGAGNDATILDFIKERTDTIGTNVQPDTASMLLRLTGFKRVVWKDLHAKCTTKSGPIDNSTDPSAGNPSVYYGSVWFSHMQDCDNVRFENVKMQRGNFRGFSVDAQNLPIGNRTKVSMINCEGFENTSTGFWFSFCNSLYVRGGQFYRNGTRGFLATGYGIAASQYVDDVLVHGAAFYENYRKGFDRHSGVGSMVIANCVFADNILRDIEDNKQYNAQYGADKLNYNHYSNCQFLLNRNKTWLADALSAVAGNASCLKAFVSNLDRLIDGTIADKQREISFSHCSFRVLDNVPDGYAGFNGFSLEAPIANFDNCVIDTTGFRLADSVTGNAYSSFMFASSHAGAVIRLRNTTVKTHPGKIMSSVSSQASNSVLFTTQANTVLETDNCVIDVHNFILTGVTGSGTVSESTCKRRFNNTVFKFRDLQLVTHSRSFANAFSWINSGYGFKGGANDECITECSVGFGDAAVLSPLNVRGNTGAKQAFIVPAQSKAVAAEVEILLGQTNGNVHIAMSGALELQADSYRAGWRYSSWGQTVYSGSSYVGVERTGTKALTYNGANTNFLATRLRVYWAVAAPGDTGWYNGEISASDAYLPLILRIA